MNWAGGSGNSGGGNGGSGSDSTLANAGTINTGGGGGGSGQQNPGVGYGKDGGSGIIILRASPTDKFSVSPGSNTVTSTPTYKVATFNVSGTLSVGKD
jgi:hypothetical protein